MPELKIVGGNETDISLHPWQVSLLINGENSCGGTFITDQWVLTAGHCLNEGILEEKLMVRAGSSFYKHGGKLLKPAKLIIHEDFNILKGFENDIGLIKFQSPVHGDKIKPLALPSASDEVPVGGFLSVTGWGYTALNESNSNILKEVSIPRISQTKCQANLNQTKITDNMLCAGVEEGGSGTCTTDSGDPAIYKNQLVGFVTYSYGCALPHLPTIFTRVSKYLPWILRHIENS